MFVGQVCLMYYIEIFSNFINAQIIITIKYAHLQENYPVLIKKLFNRYIFYL